MYILFNFLFKIFWMFLHLYWIVNFELVRKRNLFFLLKFRQKILTAMVWFLAKEKKKIISWQNAVTPYIFCIDQKHWLFYLFNVILSIFFCVFYFFGFLPNDVPLRSTHFGEIINNFLKVKNSQFHCQIFSDFF